MDTDSRSWNLTGLCVCYGIAALVLSYLMPATRALWDGLDTHVAFLLNSLTQRGHPEQLFWAFANLRVFDYIAALILLSVLIFYVARRNNATMRVRAARVTIVCVMLLVLVALTREFLFQDVARDSPSLVLESFTMLSEQTSLDPKDSSGQSFPGDHATVVATFSFLLWCFAGWRYGLVSSVLATLFVLPRLVSGAHWLSDAVIGGVVTALVTVPIVVFTPLAAYLIMGLVRCFDALSWLSRRRFPDGSTR